MASLVHACTKDAQRLRSLGIERQNTTSSAGEAADATGSASMERVQATCVVLSAAWSKGAAALARPAGYLREFTDVIGSRTIFRGRCSVKAQVLISCCTGVLLKESFSNVPDSVVVGDAWRIVRLQIQLLHSQSEV